MKNTNQRNFLVVEDNDDHAELIIYNLRKSDFVGEVVRVEDGEKALELLLSEKPLPDLILLDLKLPRLSGLEVLEKIKLHDRLKTIPVIMLTTSDSERDRATAYQMHANSYLIKPMDFKDFEAMLGDVGRYWVNWNQNPA